VKLTLDGIVDAGMDAFATHGYAGLSMRQVAERLGVHAGSLYYHVRNKEALLALLADRIAGEAYAEGSKALAQLPEDAQWPRRIEEQMLALRHTLHRHVGGPFLLASSPVTLSPGALSLMERLLATLRAAGVPAGDRPVAADTLLSYVTGFVLQEQIDPVTAEIIPQLRERFPMTLQAQHAYNEDDLFRRSIRLQCTAIAALISAPGVDMRHEPGSSISSSGD
jgi:TetR/AcrR family tetracycline transcriptional repressor